MLEAVIFDWAGTVVDHGSRAPLQAFVDLFKLYSVDITRGEAREPMGKEKREHILHLLMMPRIRQAWIEEHGSLPDDAKVDEMYRALVPIQKQQIEQHAQLIPGVIETCSCLRDRNISVGSTTGYGREMIDGLLDRAANDGFSPDSVVAADEVALARPAATGALKNLVNLNVSDVKRCVKVDDTEPGILEGINAGMWTVAVILSGNALGMSEQEWNALSPDEKELAKKKAYDSMSESKAHYLIDSVAELPEVLDDIERRLSDNEKP